MAGGPPGGQKMNQALDRQRWADRSAQIAEIATLVRSECGQDALARLAALCLEADGMLSLRDLGSEIAGNNSTST